MWLQHIWWWIEVHTGTVNESGPYYGFWSGFGSDIQEIAIFGVIIHYVRDHNCHVRGCRSLHTYPVEGTNHRVCRKHHPTMSNTAPSAQDVLDDHAAVHAP